MSTIIGRRWAQKELRRIVGSGCQITLHTTSPGELGRNGLVAGPFQISGGLWSISGYQAVISRSITPGVATGSGRVTWVGLRTRGGEFIMGYQLKTNDQFSVTSGAPVEIERRKIRVFF